MKKMYERNITVEIRNEKEEQKFLTYCDKYGADRVDEPLSMIDGIKDDTAYVGGENGTAIFPLYYHFHKAGFSIEWDVEKGSFTGTQFIDFEKFKEIITCYEKFEENMAG